MKEICLNILQGLLLFAIGIAIVLCVAGIVYAIAHLPSWALYTILGILIIAFAYIVGWFINN